MNFDLDRSLRSKREFPRRLAGRPIEETLAMLDALRARAIALRESRVVGEMGEVVDERPGGGMEEGKEGSSHGRGV